MTRQIDKERVARYRTAYPHDPRPDRDILAALNAMKKEKWRMNEWIEAAVHKKYIDELFENPPTIPPLDPEEGWQ